MNKGNFWHKIFRSGLMADHPQGDAARYNGREAKRDAGTTRSKLNRILNNIFNDDNN